ncbi:MAG: hypothetical protein NTX66_02035 [Candidatus Falkowbacteria bacterium]|nr:hypothetical protein [Candidatus Falkowbacteria bacterium]
MKKIIWPGIVAGVVNLILNLAISFLFIRLPQIAADYNNTALIRPWSDPLMSLFFLYPILFGIILAWVWHKTKAIFSGGKTSRALKFAGSIFLVVTIPGMFMSYTCFPLAFLTVISWTFSGLVASLVAGLILVRMNE